MKESQFQRTVVADIKQHWPDCIIQKQDANQHNGIPDLLILKGDKWAMLECKKSNTAEFQPNQKYQLHRFNEMSFAREICPENKEEVLNELYRSFENERTSCLS